MMTKASSFALTKQFFFAWNIYNRSFTYTKEFNRFWYLDNPYHLYLPTVAKTLHKAIRASSLSESLQSVAIDLILNYHTKKDLITSGKAKPEDFDTIRAELASTIGRHTHCEQEKRFLEDFLKNRFYHPTHAPFLVLYSPLSYTVISHIIDNQDVLSEDEESLLTLFLLGDVDDKDLTNAQRYIIIDAAKKLRKEYCRKDAEFCKQVVELYVALFPHHSFHRICAAFNLNKPRARSICRRYLKKLAAEEQSQHKNNDEE